MPEDKDLQEGQKIADVTGLRNEGVDILTDSELRDGKNMRGVEAEPPAMGDSTVKEEVAAYLREFDTPSTKKTSGEVREPDKNQKFFDAPSPFIQKESGPPTQEAEFNPPEGVSKWALSDLGGRVLGSGPDNSPKDDWTVPQKPTINQGNRASNLQSPRFEVIKPLRTFKGDAEEAIRYQNMSVVSIRTAEATKTEKPPEKKQIKPVPQQIQEQKVPETAPVMPPVPKAPRTPIIIPWKGIFISIFSIALIGGGGTVLYIAYKNRPVTPDVPAPTIQLEQERSLIRADKSVGHEAGTNPLGTFATATVNAQIENASFIGIRLHTASSTDVSIMPKDLFENTLIPDRLMRVVGSDMALGFYENSSKVRFPFIIFKTTYFENTFIGMLDWEKNMPSDFAQLIKISKVTAQEATSTPSFVWSDKVLSNKDTRVLGNKSQSAIVYSILNRDTVLITTGEEAFGEIVKRYTESRSVR